MEYRKTKLASGREVGLRPRTWAEWESAEDARLTALEDVEKLTTEGKTVQAENLVQRAYKDTRELALTTWVENFAALRDTLTMRDIAEIERRCRALEAEEVAEKN